MKRTTFLLLFIYLVATLSAQQSQLYNPDKAPFHNAMELYYQQQYTEALRAFKRYGATLKKEQVAERNEVAFFTAASLFQLRKESAYKALEKICKEESYSPYQSEVLLMLGILEVEKKGYKQALTYFKGVKRSQLPTEKLIDFLFYQGYAYLENKEYKRAQENFYTLKNRSSKYDMSAKYYHAYALYKQGQYAEALPDFLEIEHLAGYKDIVPYYIVQISYYQQDYPQVFERANQLLAENPTNENNRELHRILGEIYYQQKDYAQTLKHLTEYETQSTHLLRNDLYMLGVAHYETKSYEKAISYLTKATTAQDFLSESSYLYIGNAYIKLGDKTNARLAYGSAIRTQFDTSVHEEAMFNYALTTYETSTALGESITALTDFLKLYPNSKHMAQAYETLTAAFLTSKNYQAAYDALIKIPNPSAKLIETKHYLLYQLGTDAYAQRQFEQAVLHFTPVIVGKDKQFLTEALFWRAESYYQLKEFAKSTADLTRYFEQPNVARNQNFTLASYSAGYGYFEQKKYNSALAHFEQYVAKSSPSGMYADALNRIGDCYFYARNFTQAESAYAKAAAANSTGADYATFQRGYVLGLMKKYSEKINVMERLVKAYPKSDYADDALYEIARANLIVEQNRAAISAYQRLLQNYPNSNLVRKASLEIGMIHFNMQSYNDAIGAYKNVISNYWGTEESFVALEGLESTYIELNQVPEYLAYVKTLGKNVGNNSQIKEDSLTYIAAERRYQVENYTEAIAGFTNYIQNYCTGGRYCVIAQYYLADSYYQINKREEALKSFHVLTEMPGNQYIEEACTRAAEIAYDFKEYGKAIGYFRKLQNTAGSTEKMNMARLGILRCSNYLKEYGTTIQVASQIVDDAHSEESVVAEARFNRAKAYMAQADYTRAALDLQEISKEVRTALGAESKYLLAKCYFQLNQLDKSEKQIMDFAEQNTRQQYWLASSLVLLSDIYVKKGDYFQAKQYLLSVQSNYKGEDDLKQTVSQRLTQIEALEQRN